MKLIHCADLHLDSPVNAHLDTEKQKTRRHELLYNFERLADYAEENGVDAVLISGDLFDKDAVSRTALYTVESVIASHENMDFYYLRGNHDSANALFSGDVPENFKRFSDAWTAYEAGPGVRIFGRELANDQGRNSLAEGLVTANDGINIVMLHGQITEGVSGEESIDLKQLRGQGIDYLALGHIHKREEGALDARGTYVYPGCLEGRGFDETGDHGFYLLEIDEEKKSLKYSFVPFSKRRLMRLTVDVSGLMTTQEMLEKAEDELSCIAASDLVSVILTGEVDASAEKDAGYIENVLSQHFFFAEVRDRTKLSVDPETYRFDESLTGEFVRQVLGDKSIAEADKGAVIRYGLKALRQEEL